MVLLVCWLLFGSVYVAVINVFVRDAELHLVCWIWGSHSSAYEEFSYLGYDMYHVVQWRFTDISEECSASVVWVKNMLKKVIDREDGGGEFVWNISQLIPDCTVSHAKR